jgi:hypothetical protein
MTITTTGLTRAAGICAAAAGAIFIAVQINHPAMDLASVETTDWVVRNTAKGVMAALALVGIAGLYLRQVRKIGVLGLIGAAVFSLGYLLMIGVEVVAAAVLPSLTQSDPAYVSDVVAAAFGGTPVGDIGGMATVLNLAGIGFMLGGVLFGIALFRAGIVTRWGSLLLAVATLATASLAVLPEEFNRPMAVPTGLALIWLGVSLFRNPGDDVAPVTTISAVERVTV